MPELATRPNVNQLISLMEISSPFRSVSLEYLLWAYGGTHSVEAREGAVSLGYKGFIVIPKPDLLRSSHTTTENKMMNWVLMDKYV